jgi:hypothetical protein
VIAKWHRFFNNNRAPNCHCLFSNKCLPNGVNYSAIKEHQIAIVLFSNKRAPNHHCLFSDKIEPNYQRLLSNKKGMPNGSDNLAMLVMSCCCHQAKTRGYVLRTVLHLLKTY